MYSLRWRITNWLFALGLKIAPAGDAKALLCQYLLEYCDEIQDTIDRSWTASEKPETGIELSVGESGEVVAREIPIEEE